MKIKNLIIFSNIKLKYIIIINIKLWVKSKDKIYIDLFQNDTSLIEKNHWSSLFQRAKKNKFFYNRKIANYVDIGGNNEH